MKAAVALARKPTLITAVLSAAALVSYVGYRVMNDAATAPAAEDLWPELADELPSIALTDLAGTPQPLTDNAGRAMLVNFWATWCAPCLREIPLLKKFHETHESIEVVGIAVDRLEPVLEFAGDMEFNYPVLIGASGVGEAYEAMSYFRNDAQVMPFSAFTAPGGAVLAIRYGELHAEDLEELAATLEALSAGDIDLNQARERLQTPL